MNPQFVAKYKPKVLEDVILPSRIKDIFKDFESEGLTHSYIFHGKFGLGKTTLAKILGGMYNKKTPCLFLNVSKDTSINLLRDKIEPFCQQTFIGVDLSDDNAFEEDMRKVVILDEFDRASIQLQEALKAFTEEYEERGIRFIGVTNHIHRVDGGLKSRFTYINFNPANSNEEKEMKIEMCKYIAYKIATNENFDIDKDTVRKIVNQCYPDFRACIRLTEHFMKYGELSREIVADVSAQSEFFELLINNTVTYDKFYHYLMDKYGDMGIGNLLDSLETPFIHYVFENGFPVEPLFKVNAIVIKYRGLLPNATDPILVGMATIGEIRETLGIQTK
jgi:replication-associated recombination protein RarA